MQRREKWFQREQVWRELRAVGRGAALATPATPRAREKAQPCRADLQEDPDDDADVADGEERHAVIHCAAGGVDHGEGRERDGLAGRDAEHGDEGLVGAAETGDAKGVAAAS